MYQAIIPAVAGIAGGALGGKAAGDARKEAGSLIQQSVNDLIAVGVPSEEAMRISLEKYKSEGLLTPEMEREILQGGTEMAGIETDPRLKEAEMAALDELRNVGQSGGMRLSDRAQLEGTLGEIDAQERGSREAILADKAQRGPLTGGDTLAAQLMNQQGAAQRKRQEGLITSGNAQDAALEAILQSGQLAGNMQGREFGQQAQVKSAQDVINQMNTQARQGVEQRNVAGRNMGQEYNLGNTQRISDANVDIANTQEKYNKGLGQTRFDMELQKGQALSNARSGQANNIVAGGRETADMYGKIGGGIAQMGQSYWDKQSASENAAKESAERQKDREYGISTGRR